MDEAIPNNVVSQEDLVSNSVEAEDLGSKLEEKDKRKEAKEDAAIEEELPVKKRKLPFETHAPESFEQEKLNLLAEEVENRAASPVKGSGSAHDKSNLSTEEVAITTAKCEGIADSKKEDSRNDSELTDNHQNAAKVVSEPEATTEKNDKIHISVGELEEKPSLCYDDKPPKLQPVDTPTDMRDDSNIEGQISEENASKEDDQTCTTPRTENDIEMVDAASTEQLGPTPEMEDPQTGGYYYRQAAESKTLFVGNLSFSVEQTDVEEFFKDVGEIVSMRFPVDKEGIFKGFGYVEFATYEAAQEAMKLNRQELLGRHVKLDYAREKVAYTPNISIEKPNKVRERIQGTKIYVRGFDTNNDEEKIRIALTEHFAACGEITRVSIPMDYDGSMKGIAYIFFKDTDGSNNAMELAGSKLGEKTLVVEEARARDRDNTGGRYGSSSGGYGSYGTRDSGGYGSYGTRDRGGYGSYGAQFSGRGGGRDGGNRWHSTRDGNNSGYGSWHSGRNKW